MEAWAALAFPGDPPTRIANTRFELVRLLVLAGEAVRAETYFGKLDSFDAASAVLRLSKREAAPIVEPRQRYTCSSRISSRRTLERVHKLYFKALEDGGDSIALSELALALRDSLPVGSFTP